MTTAIVALLPGSAEVGPPLAHTRLLTKRDQNVVDRKMRCSRERDLLRMRGSVPRHFPSLQAAKTVMLTGQLAGTPEPIAGDYSTKTAALSGLSIL